MTADERASPDPQPDPTQDQANDFKSSTHGGLGVPPAPPTVPPVNVDPPLVSGQAIPGQTLYVTLGNWQNLPTSFAGEWQGDGIYLATGAAYNVMETDVGTSVVCIITATNAAGSTTVTSNAVVITAAAAREPGRRRDMRPQATTGGYRTR